METDSGNFVAIPCPKDTPNLCHFLQQLTIDSDKFQRHGMTRAFLGGSFMADDMEKKGQQGSQPGQGQQGGQSGQHGQGQQTGQSDPKKVNQGQKQTDDEENQDRDRQRRAS